MNCQGTWGTDASAPVSATRGEETDSGFGGDRPTASLHHPWSRMVAKTPPRGLRGLGLFGFAG